MQGLFLAYFVLQGSNAKTLSTYNIPLTIYSFHTVHLFVLTHNVKCAYSNRHNKYTATNKTKLVIRFFQNNCALQLIFNLNIAVPLNVCSPTDRKSKSIPSFCRPLSNRFTVLDCPSANASAVDCRASANNLVISLYFGSPFLLLPIVSWTCLLCLQKKKASKNVKGNKGKDSLANDKTNNNKTKAKLRL